MCINNKKYMIYLHNYITNDIMLNMRGGKMQQKKKSKDLAYEYISTRIISGEYAANEKIDDIQIAMQLGISKTPIRDAIQLLVAQNFLKSSSKVGTTVIEFNIDSVHQIYEPLAKINGIAAKNACLLAKKNDIENLKYIVTDIRSALEHKDTKQLIILDKQFHDYILKIADNPYIIRFNNELAMQARRIEYVFKDSIIPLSDKIEHYNNILKAFRRKDSCLCESTVEEKILNTIPDLNFAMLAKLSAAIK